MFRGAPTEIEGFVIPYDGTAFLVVLGIHVIAAIVCVVSGLWAMLSEKRKGAHTKSGSVYFWSLLVVFITATLIAIDRWQEDYHLFILAVVSFAAAFVGRMLVRKKGKLWPVVHISGMGLSYIFLLIAFYVDNGKFLPLWKELAPYWYWLLPLLIGIPLLVRTLVRHPLSRKYFR